MGYIVFLKRNPLRWSKHLGHIRVGDFRIWDKAILPNHSSFSPFLHIASARRKLLQIYACPNPSCSGYWSEKRVSIRESWKVWQDPRTVSKQTTAPSFSCTLSSVTTHPLHPFSLKDQHILSQVTVTSQKEKSFPAV